jgi:hypothetical protein
VDLSQLQPHQIPFMSNNEFRAAAAELLEANATDRRENAIRYYEPVSEKGKKVHTTTCKTVGVFGGNGSGKTEQCIAEMAMLATGLVPDSLAECVDPREKLRGPVSCRVVLESLTTTMHNIILPKLQWWKWTGIDQPGGQKGHWGWIPRTSLLGGDWTRAWSEKLRTLRINYYDPWSDKIAGESTIQFMSKDQDPSDFASGDFHLTSTLSSTMSRRTWPFGARTRPGRCVLMAACFSR